jgi:capsular exopolysaccharide synthesis family protein
MAKTFEALQRAEAERRTREVETGGNGGHNNHHPGSLKITPQTVIEHHRLKYNLLRLNPGKKIKALLFSSPTRGEGTSTVLINFATSLAADGDRVLLVDANLRNPSLHGAFDLERENGLTELLLNQRTLEEVIKETGIPHLFVITSGVFFSNPFVILESDSLKTRTEEMKANADWVLIDCPAITSCNDAASLAGSVDGLILVVEAERTRWEVAENARKSIKSGNGNVLGVVLNKRRYHIPNWLYKRL